MDGGSARNLIQERLALIGNDDTLRANVGIILDEYKFVVDLFVSLFEGQILYWGLSGLQFFWSRCYGLQRAHSFFHMAG